MVLATIIAFSVMIVGVLAVTNVSLNLGGTINFIVVPTDVYLNSVTLKNTVTQSSNGYQAGDVTLSEYSDIYIQEDTSLDLSNVQVLAGQTMEIDIDMISLNKNYLKVNLTYNNLPSTVTINSTSLYMPQNTTGDLVDGQERTYKIYIKNTASTSLNLSSINLNVSFEEKTSLLQNDTTNHYWYVEMGTYPTSERNEYIKWRYISADGENPYTYSTTAPEGMGYFILANALPRVHISLGNYKFEIPSYNDSNYTSSSDCKHVLNGWTNIPANDYSTSAIRRYINGETIYKRCDGEWSGILYPTGEQSNLYKDINIDTENDIIYNQIIGRTLGDLYSEMSSSGGIIEFPIFNSGATIKYYETDVDKFWCLSYKEANALLSESGLYNEINSWFGLRTPTSDEYGSFYYDAFIGDVDSTDLEYSHDVFPAFKLIN